MKPRAIGPGILRWQISALCAWLLLPGLGLSAGPYRALYSYDDAGRMTSTVYDRGGTNGAFLYEYDAVGNWTRLVTLGSDQPTLDSDGDGLPDLWELRHLGSLGQTGAADPDTDGLSNSNELAFGSSPVLKNTDGDPQDDYAEWIADTNPTNAASFFQLTAISATPPIQVCLLSSSNRLYTLQSAANLTPGGWTNVPGQTRVAGSGNVSCLTDTNSAPQRFYRIRVELP